MTRIHGQCHCGKNQLKVKEQPQFQFICYCSQCRVINSGGHLCGMMFDEGDLSLPEDTTEYVYPGGSGQPIKLHFCSTCGAHLYSFPTQYAGKVVVRANILIGADFKPQQPLFTESAFSWDATLGASNTINEEK